MMQVIFETSRLATIVNGVLRKTTREMQINGEYWGASKRNSYRWQFLFDDCLHYLLGAKRSSFKVISTFLCFSLKGVFNNVFNSQKDPTLS